MNNPGKKSTSPLEWQESGGRNPAYSSELYIPRGTPVHTRLTKRLSSTGAKHRAEYRALIPKRRACRSCRAEPLSTIGTPPFAIVVVVVIHLHIAAICTPIGTASSAGERSGLISLDDFLNFVLFHYKSLPFLFISTCISTNGYARF